MAYGDKAFWMVSVKALVVEEGRVLLLQRHSFDGGLFWDAPGGTVDDPDEEFSATLQRELEEEIGYTGQIAVGALAGMQRWHEPASGFPPKLTLFFAVSACDAIAEPLLSDEHAGYHWASLEDLPALTSECRLEPELAAALRTLLG